MMSISKNVKYLDLPKNIMAVLEESGIKSIDQFLSFNEYDFLGGYNIGKKSIELIREEYKKFGRELKPRGNVSNEKGWIPIHYCTPSVLHDVLVLTRPYPYCKIPREIHIAKLVRPNFGINYHFLQPDGKKIRREMITHWTYLPKILEDLPNET